MHCIYYRGQSPHDNKDDGVPDIYRYNVLHAINSQRKQHKNLNTTMAYCSSFAPAMGAKYCN